MKKRKRKVTTGRPFGGGGYMGIYGYGGYGNWGIDRDGDGRDDLTMTSNLGEQFAGYSDGGGDAGGGDGGGGE